tara:strand:- start:126 stop:488 length:363 start_codon:yes stop_codon:yes gene_type:complete
MTILTKGQKIFMHVNALQDFIKNSDNIDLKENDPEAYEEKISTKFKQLKEKYELIYNMASTKIFDAKDYAILKMMLDKKDRLDSNEISEEQASKEIGQNLYNTYVSHLIDEDKENKDKKE